MGPTAGVVACMHSLLVASIEVPKMKMPDKPAGIMHTLHEMVVHYNGAPTPCMPVLSMFEHLRVHLVHPLSPSCRSGLLGTIKSSRCWLE
jgi:hypothetical protein